MVFAQLGKTDIPRAERCLSGVRAENEFRIMTGFKASDRFVDDLGMWNEAPAGPPLTAQAAGLTDRGLVREANEDHYLIAELAPIRTSAAEAPANRVRSAHAHLFLVADGMGGYAGGSVASRITAHTVEACLLDLPL